MAKSILQDERICFLTGRSDNLEEHHVFGGMNRKISEKYGLKVYLTREEHTGRNGVHQNREKSDSLKAYAQRAAMEHYGWNIDQFRIIFGKNYI